MEEHVTDAEVYAYMDNIPAALAECAAAKHDFKPHDWHGWNANGRAVKNPRNAVALDVTERCKQCGLKRHFTITANQGRPIDCTTFTYSERNPLITSPHGVSETGVSVRREMRINNVYGRILTAPIELRQPSSKSGKSGKARGAA
ncbi:hypothetical protein ACFVXC_05425 [Streptomyces sp. NPDC058257]|uniref:hypothetical protein n=1 Tax=Streptomyces sp. NPDC058257 TaxID=3346409 RepID=UPI0036E6CAD1